MTRIVSRLFIRLAIAASLVATLTPTSALTAGQNATYRPVTTERLLDPEPRNWLMYRGGYDGWGYSALDQITPENVGGLEPVWSFSTGVREGHEAPPIVNDGRMFVTTPQNQVFALDAATGDLLWRYARELPEDLQQSHPTNRGGALYDDMVFVGTVDPTSSRWTRPRARSCGSRQSRTTGQATTSRWHRSWPTAR